MIFWHMGVAALIVYVTLGRRRIDYRYMLLGAVLPDVIDGLHALLTGDGFVRWVSHSLITVIAVAVVIILCFKGERRLAVFGIAVGWLLHLVADAMWEAPETFLWPMFGFEFDPTSIEPYSWDLFIHPLDHIGIWLGELAGLAILAWFWVAFRLGEEDRRRLFLKDGYLRP
jgi:hypothetical protein